jgi:hypothetical protein
VLAGASGVIAVAGFGIGVPALAYGIRLGNDAQAITMGDAGDLYLWVLELLGAGTLLLVGGCAILAGGAASIVAASTGMMAFWRRSG